MASKIKGNPKKPSIGARIKNAFGKSLGLTQSKGGAKFVAKQSKGKGLTQSSTTAKKAPAAKKGAIKKNLSKIAAQPKSPKNLGAIKQPRNKKVTAKGGSFKAFIG